MEKYNGEHVFYFKDYKELIEKLHEGIVITSLDHRFMFVNPAAEKIFGVGPGELVGKSLHDYVDEEEFIKIKDGTARRLEGQTDSYDFKIIKPPLGEERIINVTASPYIVQGKVNKVLSVYRDITEKKKMEETVHYLTFHDSLTGLYNRDYLEQEMERLDTDRQMPISVIMADLNILKLINDTYGHEFGDKMLYLAGRAIQNSCRSEDVVARVGGDEFLILLPKTRPSDALAIQERIHEESRKVFIEELPISLALGAATKYSPKESFSYIIRKAEEKMYTHKLTESRKTKNELLKALFRKLGYSSYETQEHTWRMQNLAFKIGESIKLSEQELTRLANLISLHDIGKTNIPFTVLNKKGKLTESEWKMIKKHPETGYRIALSIEEFINVAEEIFAHHEWYNGSGYPRNLIGDNIPVLSRITAIVDAYDVITSGRPYREALPKEEALEEIKKFSGKQFDPGLVEIFLSVVNKNGL